MPHIRASCAGGQFATLERVHRLLGAPFCGDRNAPVRHRVTEARSKFWTIKLALTSRALVANPPQTIESAGLPCFRLGLYSVALAGGRDPDRRGAYDSYDEHHDEHAQDWARHLSGLASKVVATSQGTCHQCVGGNPLLPPSWRVVERNSPPRELLRLLRGRPGLQMDVWCRHVHAEAVGGGQLGPWAKGRIGRPRFRWEEALVRCVGQEWWHAVAEWKRRDLANIITH